MRTQKEIRNEYRLNRNARKLEHEVFVSGLYGKYPELGSLRNEKQRLFISQISGDISEEECGRLIDEADSRIKSFLSSEGMTEDIFEYRPLCAACSDTGSLNGRLCSCLNNIIGQELSAYHMSDADFDSFSLDIFPDTAAGSKPSPRENMARNLEKSKNFVRNFDDSSFGILFAGAVGTGKTFLSNCIARELIKSGKSVVMVTAYKMIEDLIKLEFGKIDSEECDIYFSCDLLVIDDLGQERKTEFTQRQLFNVINERMTAKKKMLISTNLSTQELMDAYDQRIFSRLLKALNGLMFYGPDLRGPKNTN